MALLLVLAMTIGAVVVPAAAAAETMPGMTAVAATTDPTVPPAGSVLFGAAVSADGDMLGNLDRLGASVGSRPGVVMWYQHWAEGTFDQARAAAVSTRGALPMVTWEPWDWRGSEQQSRYALAAVSAGLHDGYIRSWARAAQSFGKPLLVRFGHEMNGDWYPWAEAVNGNRPGDYVAAWRHVVGIFRAEGVANVSWVWSPNVEYPGSTALDSLYPGDDWVDWVALDGYNGGSALPWGGWVEFDRLYSSSLEQIRAIAPSKPVMIGETASTEEGGDKARWIDGFFDTLERRPEIRAFVWFNHDKETDWRVESSPRSQQAFAARLADARYRSAGPEGLELACGSQSWSPLYRDVPSTHTHWRTIACATTHRIVAGRPDGTFAPERVISRAQMATFLVNLLRAAGRPLPASPDIYTDVLADDTHRDSINRAGSALGFGCAAGRFCPDAPVTRAQMATFVATALTHANGFQLSLEHAYDGFTDLDGSVHAPRIRLLAATGVARGFSAAAYGPDVPVTRAQMATFVARALDLALRPA